MKREHILAVTAEQAAIINSLGDIKSEDVWLIPREAAETNTMFRQIIPYLIIRCEEKVLIYRRPVKGNEQRLTGKVSIGIGGHINLIDVLQAHGRTCDEISAYHTIWGGTDRELQEELGILAKISHELGLIRLSDTPVNAVHLGICYLVDISAEQKAQMFFDEGTIAGFWWEDWEILLSLAMRGLNYYRGYEIESWTAYALRSFTLPA